MWMFQPLIDFVLIHAPKFGNSGKMLYICSIGRGTKIYSSFYHIPTFIKLPYIFFQVTLLQLPSCCTSSHLLVYTNKLTCTVVFV